MMDTQVQLKLGMLVSGVPARGPPWVQPETPLSLLSWQGPRGGISSGEQVRSTEEVQWRDARAPVYLRPHRAGSRAVVVNE